MKIIILGAGQVGGSVATALVSEANEVTVVDVDHLRLRELQEHLDIRTVAGHASHPQTLKRAGAEDADMILAVTNSDEINMVACQIAYTLFQTPTKIARVRAPEYSGVKDLFVQDAIPVDVIINPEQLVVEYILGLIKTPGALQVMDFAGGKVRLAGIMASFDSPLRGHALRDLPELFPDVEIRVAAIFRQNSNIVPEGDTVIEEGDEVFFVAAAAQMQKLTSELNRQTSPSRNLIIAGGGNIGLSLAQQLESKFNVKLIEYSTRRAEEIAPKLNKAIVLRGDAADESLLLEENIDSTDVFCAVTNDEQVNILSAMLAKQLGARKVMALINRGAYVDLVESSLIDVAISPSQTTISSLLAHIRKGDVVAVHSLRRGAAEAIEAVAHGEPGKSKVVGKQVDEIKLPSGTTIDAIVRGDEVMMAHHDTLIEADDHVILFLSDKSRISEVEKLFQVPVTFL
jgi:trk system potassium uptake protein TrkA